MSDAPRCRACAAALEPIPGVGFVCLAVHPPGAFADEVALGAVTVTLTAEGPRVNGGWMDTGQVMKALASAWHIVAAVPQHEVARRISMAARN